MKTLNVINKHHYFIPSFLPSVFCCIAGYGYPSTVSPHRPFCSCLLECYVVTVHGQIMKHLRSPSASSLFTQHFTFKNPYQKTVMSQHVTYPCFCCHISFNRLLSSFTLFNTSTLDILSFQLIFSIRLQIHISKFYLLPIYFS